MKDPEDGDRRPEQGGRIDAGASSQDERKPSSRRSRRRRRSRDRSLNGKPVSGQDSSPHPAESGEKIQAQPSGPGRQGGGGAEAKARPGRSRRRRRKKVFAKDNRPARTGSDTTESARQHEVPTPDVARKDPVGAVDGGSASGNSVSTREERAVASRTGHQAQRNQTEGEPSRSGDVRPPLRGWRSRGYKREGHAPLYAALDLGTNNCRLLIAAPTRPGQFRVVDAFSRIVRLGEGLSRSGRLSEGAMDRAVEALHVCAEKLASRKTRSYRLIATEACRTAENGEAFIQRVRSETRLGLEIVDRETEARLAVSGCSSLVEEETRGVVLFDIGGGSSEIALIDIPDGNPRHLGEKIVSWTSLPVGVVSLAERFDGRDVTPESFEAMIAYVQEMIDRFEGRERLAHLLQDKRFHLLGTSGTVTTLAGIFLDLERYDRRRVDGIWMTSDQVTAMTERLLGWSFDERVGNPCIGADRADLVLAGCAILEAIRRTWPSERLRVADRGLREGILMELMTMDNAWRRGRARGGNR